MNVNKAILIGRLTRDPELKSLPSGFNVCNLSLAINSSYKKGDEKVEAVEYIDVIVFGASAENSAKYLTKGQIVCVEGRIQTRSWDKADGSGKGYKTEIVANSVQFGPKAGQNGAGSGGEVESAPTTHSAAKNPTAAAKRAPSAALETIEYPEEDCNPDDIPF